MGDVSETLRILSTSLYIKHGSRLHLHGSQNPTGLVLGIFQLLQLEINFVTERQYLLPLVPAPPYNLNVTDLAQMRRTGYFTIYLTAGGGFITKWSWRRQIMVAMRQKVDKNNG